MMYVWVYWFIFVLCKDRPRGCHRERTRKKQDTKKKRQEFIEGIKKRLGVVAGCEWKIKRSSRGRIKGDEAGGFTVAVVVVTVFCSHFLTHADDDDGGGEVTEMRPGVPVPVE